MEDHRWGTGQRQKVGEEAGGERGEEMKGDEEETFVLIEMQNNFNMLVLFLSRYKPCEREKE